MQDRERDVGLYSTRSIRPQRDVGLYWKDRDARVELMFRV